MNNRDYKQFVSGNFYHIYNRGTGKMNIFLDDSDYNFFLLRLKESLFPQHETMVPIVSRRTQLPKDSFSLIAYVLMPNHFHLLIRQNTEIPITQLMLKVTTGYSKYFNKKYIRVGSLFQDQFKAVLVEGDEQMRWLLDYIHNNPVKAGIVAVNSRYQWSSLNDRFNLCNNGHHC